ncbi:Zinc-type alcohol dehydrogenase-like protein [Sinobacterium norvegicum]|uniref:Zinc-type alcohol dehydrogenase-like protein n=1 Tax=Sinobacterium norvegicum TaxID=1641715 RepID=A0ABM9AD38_9GAMM|nr:zinc-binding alcohol dehydrogenase family protein [Sinobacterium norvegicum]CAH0991095.1 Zinc-type alcohol dehydrogenase-like protein [Sinobacterium norvegicum]
MKAIAFTKALPISDPVALRDIELDQPIAKGNDLLVKVSAVAVNPVDYKIRLNAPLEHGQPRVLGWDAVGEVVACGELATQFKPGDKVFYAGELDRQGSNAEYQLVDQRIVGAKPKSLSEAEAAALPLTAITAWELLFDHLAIEQQSPEDGRRSDEVILVVGAAGGVGSILLQLARVITGATIIATASRPSSQQWVEQLGAHHVIDHSQPLQPQIEALGLQVTHVASLNSTESYFDSYIDLLPPFGKIALIDDPASLDAMKLKRKSLSLHFEFMYARSMFNAVDIDQQGKLLDSIADLIDSGFIKTTIGKNLGTINAENLREAHRLLESGQSIGKIVLTGFEPS